MKFCCQRALSVAVLLLWVSAAEAISSPLNWSILASFDDGTSLSGNLLYDAATHSTLDWNLATESGDLTELTYTPINSQQLSINVSTEFVFCSPVCERRGPTRELRFKLLSPQTEDGGIIPLLPGADGTIFSSEVYYDFAPYRLVTQGSAQATPEVPEPSAIALIAVVLLSMFGLGTMRRRAEA